MAQSSAKWKISLDQKQMLPNMRKYLGEIIRVTAEAAKNEWIKVARERLGSTLNVYVNGISDPELKANHVEIRLSGWMPNAIEEGSGPFDMKPGMLKHGKRTSTGKVYFTVPFGLKSAGAKGPTPPVMPSGIYRLASKLNIGEKLSLPTRSITYGQRSRLSPDSSQWGNYTWKTSPFQGVTKLKRFPGESEKTPGGKMATYKTFRRISKKSDPNSWVHPGFKAKNIMEQAAIRLEQKFPEILDKILGGK